MIRPPPSSAPEASPAATAAAASADEPIALADATASAGAADPAPSTPAWMAEGHRRDAELEQLGDRIARLSAHIQAATYRLLELIARFDAAEGWHLEGFTSCAKWLSWRTGLAPGAAREKVRVARAPEDLPVLSGALRTGELSYSAARALTRVARPDNEADLVEVARHTPAHQLERLVRAWRAADRTEEMERLEERARHAARELWLTPEADGGWRIRGRLDPEVGAVLRKALEAAGDALYRQAGADADDPAAARRADALGLVAEAALGEGLGAEAEEAPVVGRADRFQVVVRLPAAALAGPADGGDVPAETSEAGESVSAGTPGRGVSAGTPTGGPPEPPHLADGPPLPTATARRLACDAGVVALVHGQRGEVLDVGRRTRTVPAALRRALDDRDRGCRFPGCGVRFCDAHHVRPWAQGGGTKLDNLVLLCRHHHRRVHEDGWRVELVAGTGSAGRAGGRTDGGGRAHGPPEVRFRRPDGRPLPAVPPPEPVPGDPAAALERTQRALAIDGDTPTPRWTGEPLDVDWTLFTLWRPPPEGSGS